MAITERVELLKRHAQRCRELASDASDDEVAQVLRQLAGEIEETIAVLAEMGFPNDCPK